jgi:hypothetical protein
MYSMITYIQHGFRLERKLIMKSIHTDVAYA